MAQVFISYSRKDLSFVNRLAEDLKNAGLDVWYDVAGIGGGSRWRKEIEDAIRNSQYVVVILSPDAVASEWVEREFLFASNHKCKIIPLMYRSCELPLSYLDLNYIDAQGDHYVREFPNLLRALTVDPATSVLPARKKGVSLAISRNIAIAAGIVLALVTVFILLSRSGVFATLSIGLTPTSTELPLAENANPLPYEINTDGAEMILIPAGDFTMGSELDDDMAECRKHRSGCQQKWFEDEVPSRVLYLDDFYIDKYEVSNDLYKACETAGVCEPPGNPGSSSRTHYYQDPAFGSYPVLYVNWDMANAYCSWRGGSLPSEAQWEKAARGTNGNTYPWGNDFVENGANYCDINCEKTNSGYDDGYKDTATVDAFTSGVSPYGAYNMSGNVWEWVADWYAVYPGGNPAGSPYFEPPQTYRVLRGGSWDGSIDLLRTTNRDPRKPSTADDNLGFRCVRNANP